MALVTLLNVHANSKRQKIILIKINGCYQRGIRDGVIIYVMAKKAISFSDELFNFNNKNNVKDQNLNTYWNHVNEP